MNTTAHIKLSQKVDLTWAAKFFQLMANRLIVGHHRYGDRDSDSVHPVSEILSRTAEYQRTGNLELLVDVANFAALEFSRPTHEHAHFESIEKQRRYD